MTNLPERNPKWSVIYEQALRDDGTYWYPERLSEEFLRNARKLMGTQIFANQYLNEIFPAEDAVFKEEWKRTYKTLPASLHTVAFIDPAISQEDGADYTGYCVVSSDANNNWYIRLARRARMTPTEIINLMFKLHETFGLNALGVEEVAFQKALLYMAHEEMKRRGKFLPLAGIHHGTNKTKEMRIAGALVPRMEWGFLHFPEGYEGMDELFREMFQFPKGAHDDILDALASCESIMTYPAKDKGVEDDPTNPNSPNYERHILESLVRRANEDAGL